MTRILIVDDNQKNLYLLEAILKGNGYEVMTATNGAEALDAAKNDPPDALITDILMPVMDGFELCRRWKADERLNSIPVIFYTATYTDQKDQEFASKIGVDRFIIKPQKPDVLADEIKEVLDKKLQKGAAEASRPRIDNQEALQEYNEVLFHKLEQKVMQLEKEIDERKAMEEEREALISELERKNEELERFTYTVSHDLKSPLITIQGFAGLLEEDAKSLDTSRITQDIERIISAADRMQDLLKDLLALSRTGQVANPPQDASLDTIVREAIDFLAIPVIERKATFEIDPGLPVVHVDPDRIRQVYVSLIENAIKFTEPPDHPKIRIGKRVDDGECTFFVKDEGIGIDPQYIKKVFGLFEKLDGRSGGTGIGLAMVERIINFHGGRVWAESEGPGKGTTICFTLPLAAGEGTDKK